MKRCRTSVYRPVQGNQSVGILRPALNTGDPLFFCAVSRALYREKRHLINTEHQGSPVKAGTHPGLEIARPQQFVIKPRTAKSVRISPQNVVAPAVFQRGKRGFRRQHAGFDGRMDSFETGTRS